MKESILTALAQLGLFVAKERHDSQLLLLRLARAHVLFPHSLYGESNDELQALLEQETSLLVSSSSSTAGNVAELLNLRPFEMVAERHARLEALLPRGKRSDTHTAMLQRCVACNFPFVMFHYLQAYALHAVYDVACAFRVSSHTPSLNMCNAL